MRRFFLLLLLLLPTTASSTAEDTLGAPSYDTLTECTHRTVTWGHFRGKPIKPKGVSRWDKVTFAHIATTVNLGRFEIETRQQSSIWSATLAHLRPYAVMNKDFSAVSLGSRDDYSLAHEQLHFDISEAEARRLAVALATLEGHGNSEDEAREDLTKRLHARFEQGLADLRALQTRYDGETDHGEKKKKQKQWAAQVEKMFRESTEALRRAHPG